MAATREYKDKLQMINQKLLTTEYTRATSSLVMKAAENAMRAAITTMERGLAEEAAKSRRKIDFLDLPSEIRNSIYRYAVTLKHESVIGIGESIFYNSPFGERYNLRCVDGDNWRWGWSQRKVFVPPTITRVCQQLRRETLPTLPMYYGLNKFGVDLSFFESYRPWDSLESWLDKDNFREFLTWAKKTGSENLAFLTKVYICGHCGHIDQLQPVFSELMAKHGIAFPAGAVVFRRGVDY